MDPERINERMSYNIRGNIFDLINSRGWVSSDLFRRLGSSSTLGATETDDMEKNLLAVYQTVSRLLAENRVVPPGDNFSTVK